MTGSGLGNGVTAVGLRGFWSRLAPGSVAWILFGGHFVGSEGRTMAREGSGVPVHEFALAEGVIAAALQAAEEGGIRRIATVRVAVGELQQIDPETFAGALRDQVPTKSEALAGTDFAVQFEPALLHCRACGAEFGLSAAAGDLDEQAAEAIHFVPELAHTWRRCPTCGSPDFEVIRGRGIWLIAVEGAG